MSCFTRGVLRPSAYTPDTLLVVSLPLIEVLTKEREPLLVSFTQHFHVEKRVLIGWKVVTRAYLYSLDDKDHQEILAFHWHPEMSAQRPTPFPHMHISEGAGKFIRREIRETHFRTDRIAFEHFGMTLLNEFRVEPSRPDAMQVLEANLKKFVDHRTWHSK